MLGPALCPTTRVLKMQPLLETQMPGCFPPRRSLPLCHLSPFKRFHRELRSRRSRGQMVNILGFVGWSPGLCSMFFLLCYLFIFVHSFKKWATVCRGLLRNSRVGCGLTLGANQ